MSSSFLTDSHCHLQLINDVSSDALLSEASACGVGQILCVSVKLEDSAKVRDLAEKNQEVFASIGVHPNAKMEKEVTVEELCALSKHPKVIAIGETGLDYFRGEKEKERQKKRFRDHIRAAITLEKPIIVHMREANLDALSIMREENAEKVGGILHCFTSDEETARKAMDLNFLISFSGILTFPSAEELRQVAKKLPLDRLLIETDSPYLAPVPYRGKTNRPAYVQFVAETLAKLHKITSEQIAEITTQNFNRLLFKTA